MWFAMETKALRYIAAALAGFSGILYLYANVIYNMFGTLNVPIAQGGGWPYPAFFTIVGAAFLIGIPFVLKGAVWTYYLGIAFVIVNYVLYVVGAYGSIFPASPFGIDYFGVLTQIVQTVLLVFLVMLVKKTQ
jgi:hypothetical protein